MPRADRSSRSGYWMGAAAFAEAVRLPARTVRHWCARGVLPAKRRGLRIWFVDLRALKISEDPGHRAMYQDAVYRQERQEFSPEDIRAQ